MKARTFIWYMQRPIFWSYMVEELARKLKSKALVGTRDEATEWCKQCESPRDDVFEWLKISSISIPEKLKSEAAARVSRVPIEMGTEGDLDMIYSIIMGARFANCLESGVSYGWSSLAILSALEKLKVTGEIQFAQCTSVDMPYPNRNNEPYVGVCVAEHYRTDWRLIRYPDRWGLRTALNVIDGQLDFYHYDSDKTFWGRLFAWNLVRDRLKIGSIFMMDDIHDNFGFKQIVREVSYDWRVYKHGQKYIGIIKLDQ
jgi:hypothetical protein